MTNFSKIKTHKFNNSIDKPIQCDGGRLLIERLIHLFKLRNRIELAEVIGVSPGTLSTWTTRKTVPYELLIRLHLATGVSLEYLCFGLGDQYQDVFANSLGSNIPEYKDGDIYIPADTPDDENVKCQTYTESVAELGFYSIENGRLEKTEQLFVATNVIDYFKIKGNERDLVIKDGENLTFVSMGNIEAISGKYLFSIHNRYQLGELKLLPDGNTYLLDGEEKYPINPEVTKIHGKVVSELKSV